MADQVTMANTITYKTIKSDRKTIAIQIMPDGTVVVRCPKRMRVDEVRKFVESKSSWVKKHLANCNPMHERKLTDQELIELREKARVLVTERVQYYAPLVGVSYHQITIRAQHTRWGSCSSKGNLNFNCLLALAPSEVSDYLNPIKNGGVTYSRATPLIIFFQPTRRIVIPVSVQQLRSQHQMCQARLYHRAREYSLSAPAVFSFLGKQTIGDELSRRARF